MDLSTSKRKWDLWDPAVVLAPLVLLDPKVWRVPEVNPEIQAPLDPRDHAESPVLPVLLELRVILDAMVSPVQWVLLGRRDPPDPPECLACQVGRDTEDSTASLENAENKGLLVNSGRLVQPVQPVHPDNKEHVVHPDNADRTVNPVWMAFLV